MSNMREAFDRKFPTVDSIAIRAYFEAGYQAAAPKGEGK